MTFVATTCSASMYSLGKSVLLSCFVAGLSLRPCQLLAQDDLFGPTGLTTPDPNSAIPAADLASKSLQSQMISEPSVVVRSLLFDPPTQPRELATAVKLMVRIQRWDEVQRWMKEIGKLKIDETMASTMVDTVGSRLFNAVESASVGVGPNEKLLAQRILQLASESRLKPNLLRSYSQQMRSDDPVTRLKGFRGIESTGQFGLAAFFSELMGENSPSPTPIMCEALSRLEEPAYHAWNIATRTPHNDAKLNLAILANGSGSPKFTVGLQALIASSDPSDPKWNQLRATVPGSDKINTRQVAKTTSGRIADLLALYQRTKFDYDAVASQRWTLGEGARSIALLECRPADLVWDQCVIEANRLLQLNTDNLGDSSLACAILANDSREPVARKQLHDRISFWLESDEFCTAAWDVAVKYDLPISQLYFLDEMRSHLIPLSPGVRDRLIGALDSGYQAVRFTAATHLIDYVMSLDSKQMSHGLFGQSKLDRTAKEMIRMDSKTKSIVVGGNSSLRSHLKTLLDGANHHTVEFSNAAESLSYLRQGECVDMVFVVASVYEMSIPQLIQRIRANPVSSKASIAMLADQLNSASMDFLQQDARLIIGGVPPDQAQLSYLSERLEFVRGQNPPISDSDQILWPEKAASYLELRGKSF